MIRLRYFARLREQLGTGSEEMAPAASVAEVLERLRARGGVWAEAFDGEQTVLVAVNQETVGVDAPLADGDEVAFFPPVTGG